VIQASVSIKRFNQAYVSSGRFKRSIHARVMAGDNSDGDASG
jgi:hypothetical protein